MIVEGRCEVWIHNDSQNAIGVKPENLSGKTIRAAIERYHAKKAARVSARAGREEKIKQLMKSAERADARTQDMVQKELREAEMVHKAESAIEDEEEEEEEPDWKSACLGNCVFAHMGAGMSVGEIALISDQVRTATIVAAANTVVHSIDRE